MESPIQSLTKKDLKIRLLENGYPENIAQKFYDDNVDGERFLQLREDDLFEKFGNNESLIKRLQMFIKGQRRQSYLTHGSKCLTDNHKKTNNMVIPPKPKRRSKKENSENTTCLQEQDETSVNEATPKKRIVKQKRTATSRQTEQPKAVQICKAEGDTERYVLDEVALRNILCREDLKDKPVAVYSLAGSFRKGKSFMLNLFMRHLQHDRSSDWLQDKTASLRDGFRCKAGVGRCTEGLWIWSEPFLVTDKNGEEVAVYLMDTQGTSDLSTGMTGNSVIFALSTLTSSVQVFNISKHIEAHDLQLLKLFTDYGRMATMPTNDAADVIKPFQSLLFLIRDWSDTDYEDGRIGGREYLENVLKIEHKHIEELKSVRENIKESFEDVECFLMPEPGKKISKGGSKVEQTLTIGEIEDDFLDCVDDFVRYLFHERVAMKQVNGEYVTGNDLLNLTISYCKAFSSEDIPKVDTIYEASAKAAIQKTMEKSKAVYLDSVFDKLTGHFQEYNILKNCHEESKKESLLFYDRQRKMGDKKFLEKMRKKLEKDLESNFKLLEQKNIKDKVKAKRFWTKKKKRLSEEYYKNMQSMWKPKEDEIEFANSCDKICRETALLSISTLLEDYPESFVEQCRSELNSSLDQLLNYIKNHFLNKKKEAIKLSEDAKLTVKNIYVENMDKLFALKVVNQKLIEKAHAKFMEKALDHFSSLNTQVSEKYLISAKEESASVIDQLKDKYLDDNRKNQKVKTENILITIRKTVQCYKNLMNVEKVEYYVGEEKLKQKHKVSKTQAISETFGKQGKEFYEQCYQRAAAEIETQFLNIQNLNTDKKNEAMRNFNKQAEICLQNYKDEMKNVLKEGVNKEELFEAHKRFKAQLSPLYYTTVTHNEPKEEFEYVYKQLEDDVSKAWEEIQKAKLKQDNNDADLAIETAVVNCLNIIKQFMNGRHIKEEALHRLYRQAKLNRDIEFSRLAIPKKSEQRARCMQKFDKHFREIYEKNKENKNAFVQVDYDPYKDVNNPICTIL